MIDILLIILLVLVIFALIPVWPYSKGWGYYPSGIVAVLLLLFVVLLLIGVI